MNFRSASIALTGKLNPEDAYNHPKAEELVRSIGYSAKIEVDQGLFLNENETEETAKQNQGLHLQAGDRLVVCSDGLIKNRHNQAGHYVEIDELRQAV
jgi:serine/threonine protein phosphatase PrpC